MDRFYLLGFPISHSFSPKIYRRLFKIMEKDAEYSLLETRREELKSRISKILNDKDVRGFNLTQPLKEEIIRFDIYLTGVAREIGSVNCVKVKDGRLYGFNTDYSGFKRSIIPFLEYIKGRDAVIFGAGGASRSVIKALIDVGVGDIFVVNRTYRRALELKKVFHERIIPVKFCEAEDVVERGKFIVNATTVGLNGKDTLIKESWIDEDKILYDLIYNPKETEFLNIGRKKGAKVKNGFTMLYFQCIDNIRIWYGGERC